MSTVDDLKAKVKSLEDKLATATKSLNEAMIAEHPVKVGMTGTTLDGREFLVSSMYVRYGSVEICARKKTKSGWHSLHTRLSKRDGFTPSSKTVTP